MYLVTQFPRKFNLSNLRKRNSCIEKHRKIATKNYPVKKHHRVFQIAYFSPTYPHLIKTPHPFINFSNLSLTPTLKPLSKKKKKKKIKKGTKYVLRKNTY